MKRITFLFLFVIGSNLGAQEFSFESIFVTGADGYIQKFGAFPLGYGVQLSTDAIIGINTPWYFGLFLHLGSGISSQSITGTSLIYRSSIYFSGTPMGAVNLPLDSNTLFTVMGGPEVGSILYYTEKTLTYAYGGRLEVMLKKSNIFPDKDLIISFPLHYLSRADGSWSGGLGMRIGFAWENFN
ncbi:MAG: hypothetical protein A2Z96_00305 [Spirochaetes bacterium GWB1_48_6]|nr:MAG: hypothetical protein A2Z96_00305 [Spirochaetes bacterium GWB1_48_6]